MLAVLDNLSKGAGLETILLLEGTQLAEAGHGAILLHDFAAYAHGLKPCDAHHIHGAFCMPGTADNAALHSTQRETVAGLHEVIERSLGLGELQRGDGTFERADAGGRTFLGIHAHGEGGVVLLRVVLGLHGQSQGINTFGSHGHADETACMRGHKVDILRRSKLSGADEIGLVFALRVVCHKNEPAQAQLLEHFFQRRVHDGVYAVGHRYGAGGHSSGNLRLWGGSRGQLLAHGGSIATIDEIVDVERAVDAGEFDMLHERRFTYSSWPRNRGDPRRG